MRLWISQITAGADRLVAKMKAALKKREDEKAAEEAMGAAEPGKDAAVASLFTHVVDKEKSKKKKQTSAPVRRRVHWYEVLSPNNDARKKPADVAAQVAIDTKFLRLRRDGRIVDYMKEEGDSSDDDDGDGDDDAHEEIDKSWWIILPSNRWRLRWDILIFLLVVYYGIMTPVQLAFAGTELSNVYADYTFDALFALDIALNFLTAFRVESGHDKGKMEVRPSAIARTYLRKWFWIDLVATVPLDVILNLMGISFSGSFNKLVRLLRGFKLVRVLKMSRIFKRLSQASLGNPAMQRLVKSFGLLLIMWHWFACGYWALAVYNGFGDSARWSPEVQFLNAPFLLRYMQAVLWAVSANTGVGRNITPVTKATTAFSILAIATECLTYACIVGSAASALGDLGGPAAEKKLRMEAMLQFMRQRNVDKDLQERILDYYDYKFHNTSVNEDLLNELHTTLKMKLDLVLNRKLINNVPMFKDLSRNCILSIIKKLRPKIYLPKEFICVKGEKGTEMYFVLRGRVEVIVPERTTTNRVIIKEGGFFGEQCLLENSRRQNSIQALTHCELLILEKSETKRLLRLYPDFAASMQKYALGRANLVGWAKIQSIVKTVRLVRMLCGRITVVEMFQRINESKDMARRGGNALIGTAEHDDEVRLELIDRIKAIVDDAAEKQVNRMQVTQRLASQWARGFRVRQAARQRRAARWAKKHGFRPSAAIVPITQNKPSQAAPRGPPSTTSK
ncbi:hypothetical protein PBRA_001018 [Plasmodiophora brassicae]|nr:hypothetical protein PBRA_001018 [Plasmodiophora brassicae]